jgi:hypothetical protein
VRIRTAAAPFPRAFPRRRPPRVRAAPTSRLASATRPRACRPPRTPPREATSRTPRHPAGQPASSFPPHGTNQIHRTTCGNQSNAPHHDSRAPFIIVLRAMRVISLGVRRKVYSGHCLHVLPARGFRCRQVYGTEPALADEVECGTDRHRPRPALSWCGNWCRRCLGVLVADPAMPWNPVATAFPGGLSRECSVAQSPAGSALPCCGCAAMVAGLSAWHPVWMAAGNGAGGRGAVGLACWAPRRSCGSGPTGPSRRMALGSRQS